MADSNTSSAAEHSCAKCGKPIGMRYVQHSDVRWHRECIVLLDEAQAPPFTAFGGVQGWCCPRCGRGNSPFNPVCPCMPMPAPAVTS